MGGKVLELESERIKREVTAEAIFRCIPILRNMEYSKEETINILKLIHTVIPNVEEMVNKYWDE